MTKRERQIIPAMIIILSCFALVNIKMSFSSGSGSVDLFTQKEPFSGKGLNMSSDAFGPGEVVILYALVEYNRQPQQNLLVTFFVRSPDGLSFSLIGVTNATGVASINFTIPQKCPPYENETFGEWFARANVLIADNVFQDTLTFKVDWIVKLLAVRTIDANLASRDVFGIMGDVGMEITLRNIAMTEKNATLAIAIQDELNVSIGFLEIENFEVQPNEKTIFLYCKLNIPKSAHVGKAKVFVSALTASPSRNGVPYCPAVFAEFFIVPYEPSTLEFRDAAIVKVTTSATSVNVGELVQVNVKVRNEGTNFDSFTVNVYFNEQVIDTVNIWELAPYSSTTLNFTFNTSTINPGDYLITAAIPQIPNEADTTDNVFVDGHIEVRSFIKRFLVTFDHDGLTTDAHETVLLINNSPKTINDLPYSFWVEEGSIVDYSYKETVLSTISGKRFKLENIMGPSSPIIVTNNITVIGKYKIQYHLIVSSPYGSPIPLSGWYDAGTKINASVSSPWPGPEGTRYACTGWTGTGSVPTYGTETTLTFTINAPSSITWNWKTQYLLTVISPYGAVGGEGWYDANETAYASLNVGVVDHGNGTRHVFVFWSGDASGTSYTQSSPIFMDGPKTAVANWKTEYFLSVKTDPPGIAALSGEGWYERNVNVSLFAPQVEGYDFKFWDVDGVSMGGGVFQITVFMDGPHVATAHYSWRGWWAVPLWFYLLIVLLLLLVIILLSVLVYRRRKRARSEAFYRAWAAWYYGYNLGGKI